MKALVLLLSGFALGVSAQMPFKGTITETGEGFIKIGSAKILTNAETKIHGSIPTMARHPKLIGMYVAGEYVKVNDTTLAKVITLSSTPPRTSASVRRSESSANSGPWTSDPAWQAQEKLKPPIQSKIPPMESKIKILSELISSRLSAGQQPTGEMDEKYSLEIQIGGLRRQIREIELKQKEVETRYKLRELNKK